MKPPTVTFIGGGNNTQQYALAPGSKPYQTAEVTVGVDGEGGWMNQNAMGIVVNNAIGYLADFPTTQGLPSVIPNGMEFYYNIKADPTLAGRWPSLPVYKTTFVSNGVELQGNAMTEATGTFVDGTDVGFSNETLTWSSSHPDGAPWDRSYQQFYKGANSSGWDNVVYGTSDTTDPLNVDWVWWETTASLQPYLSKAWAYINKLSRYASSGKVASLSAYAPLKVIDLDSGIDSSIYGASCPGIR